MASQKEEPNTSMLFGNATDDDPFSQLSQDKPSSDKQPKNVSGDVSSLFGNTSAGNADLFFSSTNATANTTPQTANAPLTSSAASFFDQPQTSSNFFDNLGQDNSYQQDQQVPATAATYDPNAYDYSQKQQPQEQQYDQSQWIQFDPNQHYYYDEQGYVHYYDPNTNQEYDMSQYGYDQQQGQAYDYQYDPQYAEYYAQQGYDPNAYNQQQQTYAQDSNATNQQQQAYTQDYSQQQQTYAQDYTQQQQAYAQDPNAYTQQQQAYTQDPNAYAQQQDYTQQQQTYAQDYAPITQQNYYDYSTQEYNTAQAPAQVQAEQYNPAAEAPAQVQAQEYDYNPVNEAPAQVQAQEYNPATEASAQVQAEQYQNYDAKVPAEDTQNHISDQQQQYNVQQTHDTQLDQTFNYQAFEPTTTTENFLGSNEFETKDLQQQHQFDAFSPSLGDSPVEPEEHQHESSKPEDLDELDDLVLGSSDKVEPKVASVLESKRLSIKSSDDQKVPHIHLSNEPIILSSDSELDLTKHNAETVNQEPQETTVPESQQTSGYEPEQTTGYQPQQASSYEPHQTNSYEPQQTSSYEPQQPTSYEPPQTTSYDLHQTTSYEPQQTTSYEPQQYGYEPQQTTNFEPQQVTSFEPQQLNSYEPQQVTSYEPQQVNSYEPQQTATFEPQQVSSYEPQQYGYESQQTTSFEPLQTTGYEPQQDHGYEPQQLNSYTPQQVSSYEPQQTTSFEPQQVSGYAPQQDHSYEPQQLHSYAPQQTTGYEPQQVNNYGYEPVSTAPIATAPPSGPPKSQERVLSPPPKNVSSPPPPPRAGSIGSTSSIPPPPRANSGSSFPPRTNSIHSISSNPRANSINSTTARSNSIKSISSPPQSHFIQSLTSPSMMTSTVEHPYYVPPAAIERSATVPPPITERIASPRPQLVPCPDPQCEGENKPKAKFCCECGRPLAGISRSTTPAANLSSVHMEPFNPMSFGVVADQLQRNDVVKAPISEFLNSSVVLHQDRQLALKYIEKRVPLFEESKALVWNVVKTMLEHTDSVLGDGGSLDKAIVQLMLGPEERISTTRLDELEDMLLDGDREKACEFASTHDMWGHSFIIATGNSELFKRTMSKFIQRELFSSSGDLLPQVTGNNKALRLLYSTFNGAGKDAVTEFLKQAVNDDGAYTEESLAGWKRALALVLANRTPDDQKVIYELGDQLKKIASKKDEAQLCFLLSPDIPGNNLLGDDLYTDLDTLFLCELYEFASKANVQQDFKLILAWWLSELGFTEESTKYCDSIATALQNSTNYSLEDLRKLGDIPLSASNETTALLNREKFDSLISSIEEKSKSQIADSGYGGYGYGYGYDNSFSVSTEATPNAVTSPFAQSKGIQSPFQSTNDTVKPVTSPFVQPRGIQSPFQSTNDTVKPVSSPFGVQPPNAVSSPFGQPYTPAATNESSWWDSNTPAAPSTEPEATSYEPETSYQPLAQTETTPSYGDDDDDLGFGNNKTKKTAVETTEKQEEQKTSEVKDEPEPEQKSGGWGLFSLFGRHKDTNTEEKKAVKANLGESSSFYYDEKEKRWVNKLNDSKPAAATPPPPPKSMTPQPSSVATPPLKPNSMPPPRINSAPTVGGPPSGAPPTFNTPPVSSRRGAGGKKPMRSRYVDVFNQN